VPSEFPLLSRDLLSNGVIPALNQLEIGLVGLSPLGRGFLTGIDDLEPADARRSLPRFQPKAIAANLTIVEHVTSIAAELCATAAHVALAWNRVHSAAPTSTRRGSWVRR
jgi:aryl-alcohol dehydrogenase-like predicted oxidoreductase